MPFNNPIVGGTALVRPAIKSPNYVPGVSGWTINRDGSAEFAAGTFRGIVLVDGTGNSSISIAAQSGVPGITFQPADDGATIYNPGIIEAIRLAGTPKTPFLILASPAIPTQNNANITLSGANGATPPIINIGSSGIEEVDIGGATFVIKATTVTTQNGAWDIASGANTEYQSGSTLAVDAGAAFTIDGKSVGRGIITFVASQSNSGATGAEAVVQQTGSITFQDGRAYKISWHRRVVTSAANTSVYRIRKGTTTGGTAYGGQYNWQVLGAQTLMMSDEDYFTNTTGADITTAICLTLQATAGTSTEQAANTLPRWFKVEDVGAATDFANAAALT